MPEIEIIHGDILKTDWNSEADIVYCANVTFPRDMMDRIAGMCSGLKSGARIVSLKPFECNYSDYLQDIGQVNLKNSWGDQIANVYLRK